MSEAHLACLDELRHLCTHALQTIKSGGAFDHADFAQTFQDTLNTLNDLGPVDPDTRFGVPCRRKLKELQRIRDQLDQQVQAERERLGRKLTDTARGSRGLQAYSKTSLGNPSRSKRGKL